MSEQQYDLRVLSLGAGVQSSCVYLMACEGVFGDRPDVAIFADTQAEPPWVYEHLGRLEEAGDIPIHRVTAGNLEYDTLAGLDGQKRFASPPLRVLGTDGRSSIVRRQCTQEYKLEPIHREIRRLLGLKPGERAKGRFLVEDWIGISADEAHRAKPSAISWITKRYPLLFDRATKRHEAIRWLRERGYPVPEKSACYFCPFHDNRFWAALKQDHPEEFERAAEFDEKLRRSRLSGIEQPVYLHRSLQPLREIDFGADTRDQLEIDFGNECEGMCGV